MTHEEEALIRRCAAGETTRHESGLRVETPGVNVSRVCEQGLDDKVREARAREWLASNEAGFAACNNYVEKQDVPLAVYRKF